MNLIILIVAGALFTYALIYKPEIVAVALFVLILAKINFDLKGLPLNSRAIISLALFCRILFDKSGLEKYSPYLYLTHVKMLLAFMLYVILVSFSQGLFQIDLLKESTSTVLATFFVYHYYFKFQNANLLKTALTIAGIICFADLAYTYIAYGSFPIHRIYLQLTGAADTLTDDDLAQTNWNFFGQICGMGFVYLLSDYIKHPSENKTNRLTTLGLLPVMLLGVMLSTSRSAILGMLLVSILIILNGVKYRDQKRKLVRVGTFAVGALFMGILLFATLGKYVSLDSKFIDEITSRLTDEPVAIVRKAMGQSYNINNLGSMDWREESSENAYAAFMNLDFQEQFFGIGNGGFEVRDLGHGYNAHNATLLLLIENGILGFFLYFLIIGSVFFQAIRQKNFSPSFAVVCFILLYGLGQNREWTSITTFIFIYSMVAEGEFLRLERKNYELPTTEEDPEMTQEK
ncbi:MAG: O-antigen ligase family protein [Puia sp.]